MIEGQMSIYDFLDIQDPQKPPEYDRSLWEKVYPQTLDMYFDIYPDTPVYMVTKRCGVSPLFYRMMVCTFTGWWHGLQGWNIENKYVEKWEKIEGMTIRDFRGKGLQMAVNNVQYEEVKKKETKEIVEMIMRGEIRKWDG